MALEKQYHYEYYPNGVLKSEGWVIGKTKVDFWYFYHDNGKVSHEGHFVNNKRDGFGTFMLLQGI